MELVQEKEITIEDVFLVDDITLLKNDFSIESMFYSIVKREIISKFKKYDSNLNNTSEELIKFLGHAIVVDCKRRDLNKDNILNSSIDIEFVFFSLHMMKDLKLFEATSGDESFLKRYENYYF